MLERASITGYRSPARRLTAFNKLNFTSETRLDSLLQRQFDQTSERHAERLRDFLEFSATILPIPVTSAAAREINFELRSPTPA